MGTKPEVFIIESLSVKDQIFENYEGKILYEALKLQNKKPIYYYFKTESELGKIAEAFQESGYRYLHFSCHGEDGSISLTNGTVTYERFSEAFKGVLAKKRLFMSACMTGNDRFTEAVFANNNDLISITAPKKEPVMQDLTVFWMSMYNRLNSFNVGSISGKALLYILKKLSAVFGIELYYSNGKGKRETIQDETWLNGLEQIAAEKE